MTLYEQFMSNDSTTNKNREQRKEFWDKYFKQEKEIYKKILDEEKNVVKGTVAELAKEYRVEPSLIIGFLTGIETSLNNELPNLEEIDEDTEIELDIDFEKLYYNMRKAKAPWLFNLEEWDKILPEEKREAIAKQYKEDMIFRNPNKVGRNDPCPCGSGKKYKKCCGSPQKRAQRRETA